METKELKIQVPEGYEIDKENSTFEKIVFKKVENELPKSWEDLMGVSGCYVDSNSKVEVFKGCFTKEETKNVFPTRAEAEACLALSQLCQLRDRYNDGWIPDFKSSDTKYAIKPYKDGIDILHVYFIHYILTFETHDKAYKFLEDHRGLIEQAKPLL